MYTSIIKKDDVKMTEKRRRMLESFLNNIAKNDILGNDAVFKLFLKDSLEWSEESLKLVDLQDKTALLSMASVEQAAHKYDTVIDRRLVEYEKTFGDLKSIISCLEDAERTRVKRSFGTIPSLDILVYYEALCELGCTLNAFSIEYSQSPINQIMATTGESFDADAAALHDYLLKQEAYCDGLHMQVLYCQEAHRLIMYMASAAVKCDNAVRLVSARRSQLLLTPDSDDDPVRKQQLHDIDDEKRVVENDYQRVFNYGLEELSKLGKNMQSKLSEIIESGSVEPLHEYHAKCQNIYASIVNKE